MDERDWWVRRAVLLALLVVGAVTTTYAVVAVRDEPAPVAAPVLETTPTAIEPPEPRGPLRRAEPILVGRHGVPVQRPLDTRESYEAALAAGVDYIETQTVATSDGQLIVRHEPELSASTNVADMPEFADRRGTRRYGEEVVRGWFTEDFTLAELRTLRAREPFPELRARSAVFDDQLELITLAEVLALVQRYSERTGEEVGVFVQPLRAGYYRSVGLPMDRELARVVRASGLLDAGDPERVVIEAGGPGEIPRYQRRLGDEVSYVVVIETDDAFRLEPDQLDAFPDAVDGVSVEVGAFRGEDPFELVQRVHDRDLAFLVWPISFENELLAPGFRDGTDPSGRGNLDGQVSGLVTIGVDGIMAEAAPDVAGALMRRLQSGDSGPEEGTEEPVDRLTEGPEDQPTDLVTDSPADSPADGD